MLPVRMMLMCLLLLHAATAVATPAIEIDKVERTNTGMTIRGSSATLPPGTKLWATTIKFNGKPVGDAFVLSDNEVRLAPDRRFVAHLKRNNKSAYPPAQGSYQVELYAIFNRAWQEVAVLKAAGARLDNEGRVLDSEPRALSASPDLVKEELLGERPRVLRARRTVQLKGVDAPGTVEPYTKKVIVEIHDINADNNPIRAFDATALTVNAAIKKARPVGNGRAMSVICRGDFKDGMGQRYLADDLITPEGRPNPAFAVNDYAVMMDICVTQEMQYRARQRK